MRHAIFRAVGGLALALLLGACRKAPPPENASRQDAAPAPQADTVDLLFTYGSEKEEWVKAVTADFNRQKPKVVSGKFIRVRRLRRVDRWLA